jgi:alpha-beta hydrolase superfamily lysophospholipase
LSIPTGLDSKLVSRDPDVVTAYDSDPMLVRNATARWYLEFLNAQARAFELAPRIEVPALVMQAGADGLVSPEASERFFTSMGSKDKTFKSYESLYHELFNEFEKEQVFDDVAAWLKARIG